MMLTRLAALIAAMVLTCAPALAQDVRTLPTAAPLTGTEKMPAVQGAGCPTKTAPCASVAVTPALVGTFLGATFQAKDADIDAIAALTTQPFGRGLLGQVDAAAARTTLGSAARGTNGDITSLTGLTTPLSATQGGTGDAGTAWTAYTPTLSCLSGTLTSATTTGRSKRIGKTVFVQVRIAITTNGTCATAVRFTLPASVVSTGATADSYILSGREDAATGSMLQGVLSSGQSIGNVFTFSNGYPGGDGRVLLLSGSYEAA